MPLNLRQILELDVVTSGRPRVLAGHQFLDRPVRWMHVTEIEAIGKVLGGNEVVLTTGLPLAGPLSRSLRFLDQLVAADACGLVVELGQDLLTLQGDVVAAAERHGLPLIVLQSPVRFVSITEAVHRLIVGEHYAGLDFAQRTHEVFTDLSLDSADAQTILTEAAVLIDGPMVLEDAGHRVVAVAAHRTPSRTLLSRWEARSRRAPVLDVPGTSGPEGWSTCPVGLRGAVWGRLIAPVPSENRTQTATVMQRAAQALQLSRLVEQDAHRLEIQARESLLQQLVDGTIRDESSALARAYALGMPRASWFVPVVVAFDARTPPGTTVRHRRSRSLTELVITAMRAARAGGIAGALASGHVGIVLTITSRDDETRALTALASKIEEGAARHNEPRAPAVGVGEPTNTMIDAASLLSTTTTIATAALAMGAPVRSYFRSTDVRIRGLIAQLVSDDRLIGFVESELGPLLARDAQTGTVLIDLLRHYVRLNGNKAAVAKAAHVSRQTLYTRLRMIETSLRIDLDAPDSMLSLGVALLALQMRQSDHAPFVGF